jgi:fumarate hydratase class II
MKKRIEKDSLGEVEINSEHFWGPQTQRSLIHFSIGRDLMPEELVYSYLLIKAAAAVANYKCKKISNKKKNLILSIVDKIKLGEYKTEFPLHVWMTGSGTQFNMNINEVIANIASQLSGNKLGSKIPLHPNDDINMSQSSNDTFPTAMHISAFLTINNELLPVIKKMHKEIAMKVKEWAKIIKIGRTHMQDAVPISLGQEFSAYENMLSSSMQRIKFALNNILEIPLGGTAVGTGLNAPEKFSFFAVDYIAKITKFKFKVASNNFALQGAHDNLMAVMSELKNLAVSLFKIANDIRLLSCGPRAGFFELIIPQNEPGSSIMPGKVNPTQCEALAMVCAQVIGLDVAVSIGCGGGYLQMNVYKPMIIFNILNATRLLKDSINNFTDFLLVGLKPNNQKIATYVENSLMLVTVLSPIIGYDKASILSHYAYDNNCSLKEANDKFKFLNEVDFQKYCDPKNMI